MQKYNASAFRFGPAGRGLAALCCGVLAACAGTPPAADPTIPPVPPERAAPTIEPVTDGAAAAAAAGELSLRADAPLRYVVKKGDTLWDIAGYYLRDPWQWPALWYVNPQIRNPHLIYPGEVLRLVMVNGRPRLMPEATEKLEPQVRESPLAEAIPAIPIDAIRQFLNAPRLVSKDEAERAPYVVAYTDEHVIAAQNNGIYVKNLPSETAAGWSVVQIGGPYIDPDSGDLLGYEAIPAGEAELVSAGPPAEMTLSKSYQEVLIGDRLLPQEAENFQADFYPHPPARPVDGTILSVFGGVSQIAQYQIVALNRGSEAGLDPGTVLSIYQKGRKVPDPYGNGRVALPEQQAGLLMVFKTTPRLSYALVLSDTRPVHVLDKVRSPQRPPAG
ncbi:MAG: LysM peptidoglycan-binding domain-containing protein [Nevskia sp.]|nr:LysM peptidoglycan-binding domain-containing protein [Nevskia sp.]